MYLVCHGGHCCGIKHIYNISSKPSNIVSSLVKMMSNPMPYDNGGSETTPGKDVFADGAPREEAWRRLDRFLKYIDRRKPKGIVEVVVISPGPKIIEMYGRHYTSCYRQYDNWKPTLLKRGFKEVNSCENVNSGAILHVFHRNSGEVSSKVKPLKTKPNKPVQIIDPFS